MSTDLYMHSVYYSMMLLEGTNYDFTVLTLARKKVLRDWRENGSEDRKR